MKSLPNLPAAPRAATRKALLVDRVGGPLSNLTPAIQALGCEVARAAEARAAATLASSMRLLTLLVVNGEAVGNESSWLISSVKTQHPALPILWYTTDAKANGLPAAKLDLVTPDLTKLQARISSLLGEEYYAPAFIQQVITGVRSVLGEFAMASDPSEPCVKANLSELSEINALIGFYGQRLSGHVVLSTSGGDLTAAYRARFPRVKFPGTDDLEDLLGEIANQIVGQLKRSIQLDGAECKMGMPYFIRGSSASIRYKGGIPCLAIDFGSGGRKLHVELCVHRFDGGTITDGPVSSHLKPGTIQFL